MSASPILLTRYRDVRDAQNDARLVMHKPLAVADAAAHVAQAVAGERSHRVGPLWQRLAQQLRPTKVATLSAFVEASIDQIADEAQARGGMEVVSDLAFPLPVAVMADLLGLRDSDSATYSKRRFCMSALKVNETLPGAGPIADCPVWIMNTFGPTLAALRINERLKDT